MVPARLTDYLHDPALGLNIFGEEWASLTSALLHLILSGHLVDALTYPKNCHTAPTKNAV